MKILRVMLRTVIVFCILAMFGFTIYNQWIMRQDFLRHWHYAPKHYEIELAERRISQNIPYHLTERPKPKQTQSPGYIYWYGYWR